MIAEHQKETRGFQTEVKQLLHLMINALYSNKEIFLRELISNASDAADKLRFLAINDDAIYENDAELKVRIDVDPEARTLTISDNGVGMSREEVIENLGTIAKSGTREFLSHLSGDQTKDSHLIGQFGVGFYAAFIVADKVTVETRRAGLTAAEGVRWESQGEGDYTIETIEQADRGTHITLHLREGLDEFLEAYRLRNVIKKYSDHINLPIEMLKAETPDFSAAEEATADAETAPKEKPKAAPEYEVINDATALWTQSKRDLTDNDYQQFYKHISHDYENPLAWSHNKVEGKLEYTSLLYIPRRAPYNLYDYDQKHGLKLYVQRVFIMDDADQFLPRYLRFVKGIVDSNDLPLNISREILQNDGQVETIRKATTRKILSLLEEMAEQKPDDYQIFWKAFGNVIKEGPAEDYSNRETIAKLMRFASTRTDTPEQNISFSDYIANMKPGQEVIYYITGETFAAARKSPHLEIFREKNIEVLLLSDRIDEWLVGNLTEFEGKKLQSVAKGDLELGDISADTKAEHEALEKDFESIVKQAKEVLGEKVKDVRTTYRLTDSPACIVVEEHELGGHLQRMLKAAGQTIPESKPILELNPKHQLLQRLKAETDDERFKQWMEVLLDQAMLAEGAQVEDPAGFVQRLNRLWLDLV